MSSVGKHRSAVAAKPFCARNAAVTGRQESLAVAPIVFRLSGFCGLSFSYWFAFDVICVLGSGFGVFLLISSGCPPPLSAGAGLGSQAALLRHRTCFMNFWAGFGGVPAFFIAYTPTLSAGAFPSTHSRPVPPFR